MPVFFACKCNWNFQGVLQTAPLGKVFAKLATLKVAKMLPRGGKFGKNKQTLCALLSTRCLVPWWVCAQTPMVQKSHPRVGKMRFSFHKCKFQLLQRLQVLLSVAQDAVLATIRFVLQNFATAFCVCFCQ